MFANEIILEIADGFEQLLYNGVMFLSL